MRIPLSWLREYISITLSPHALADKLTMAGLEVDHIEEVGADLREIVVVRVLETSAHPHADKLQLATLSDGKETFRVVCGAPNCRPGIKAAFARVGVTLKDQGQPFKIKKAKIRGIESEGMLCSEQELGLSANHDEILELPEGATEGTSLADIYADVYFDISLTPNLSHCGSIWGVARESAALLGLPLRLPQIYVQESQESIEDSLRVEVVDKAKCPRYACRLIKNVRVAPSPDWLKNRLAKCGVRSVNNIVDVTNYLLLEMGHPLHAFDYEKLAGQRIIVRVAEEGETLQTLDGKTHLLSPSMLLIADDRKGAALAGIMGGSDSEIHGETRHVVLEAAYFEPSTIRRTSKQLSLQTDASKRFERGTDPLQLEDVLNRAAALIQGVAGGEIQAGILDLQFQKFSEAIVDCRLSRINQVLGRSFSRGEVEEIFKRLQWICRWDEDDRFTLQVPTYRGDIKTEIEVIEEVARFYGYENIPRQGAGYRASRLPPSPMYLFEKEIRERLLAEGLQEFINCDLVGPSALQVIQKGFMPDEDEAFVKVLNPTSIEHSILRTSLLPGLLQTVKYNFDHQNHDLAGFEVGRIHFREAGQYKEQSVMAVILMGKGGLYHWDRKPVEVDFFDLKGIVENLLAELGIPQVQFKNLQLPTFHSGRQASVFVDSLEVGSIGEIHPAIQRRLDVGQRLLFGEFNLQDLLQLAKPLEKVEPLPLYPCSTRDWTLTVKEERSFADIFKLVQQERSSLLESVTLKDLYRGDQLPSGCHNLTFHFVYRDQAGTMEQGQVDAEHHRLTSRVAQQLQPV